MVTQKCISYRMQQQRTSTKEPNGISDLIKMFKRQEQLLKIQGQKLESLERKLDQKVEKD